MKNAMKAQRLLAPICLALCLFITTVFAASTASSRHELPVGLLDIYGDTSGIRALSITGMVADTKHKYAYTFAINPHAAATAMRIHKSVEDVTRDFGASYSFIYPSAAAYIPVGETKSEIAESENSFRSINGQQMPLETYRVYAECFEVVPVMYASNIPLALNPTQEKLYITPDENSYIAVNAVDTLNAVNLYNPAEVNPAEDNPPADYPPQDSPLPEHPLLDYPLPEYQRQDYFPGFSLKRSVRLHSELTIGDKHLVVLTGKGFYGHTALYVIDAPGGHIPTLQAEGDNQIYIIAEALYPITLARGDEILGLIPLNDGASALLAIQRETEFTLVRIDPQTGTGITTHTAGEAWLNNYFLTDDSLVLVSNYWDYDYPEVHVFDLTDGGFSRVMSAQSANLWAERRDGLYYKIEAALWKNGTLYTAAYTDSTVAGADSGFHAVSGASGFNTVSGVSGFNTASGVSGFNTAPGFNTASGEVQITALAPSGTLIGRCRLLCGIEEDYMAYGIGSSGNSGGSGGSGGSGSIPLSSIPSAYIRVLKSVTLQ